jgi:hypothetical protein
MVPLFEFQNLIVLSAVQAPSQRLNGSFMLSQQQARLNELRRRVARIVFGVPNAEKGLVSAASQSCSVFVPF